MWHYALYGTWIIKRNGLQQTCWYLELWDNHVYVIYYGQTSIIHGNGVKIRILQVIYKQRKGYKLEFPKRIFIVNNIYYNLGWQKIYSPKWWKYNKNLDIMLIKLFFILLLLEKWTTPFQKLLKRTKKFLNLHNPLTK